MSKNSKNFVPTVHQKAGEINRTNPDWRLDLIRNGVPCACCGKIEYPYVNNICDCHSHGLIERHGAKYEFQVVLEYPVSVIGFVLNELGYRVRAGEVFRPGDLVEGIFEDCQVRLDKFADCDGRPILRRHPGWLQPVAGGSGLRPQVPATAAALGAAAEPAVPRVLIFGEGAT